MKNAKDLFAEREAYLATAETEKNQLQTWASSWLEENGGLVERAMVEKGMCYRNVNCTVKQASALLQQFTDLGYEADYALDDDYCHYKNSTYYFLIQFSSEMK